MQKGNLCKHLLFIMLKVIGLPSISHLIYQVAYLSTELEEILELCKQRQDAMTRFGVIANEAARNQ